MIAAPRFFLALVLSALVAFAPFVASARPALTADKTFAVVVYNVENLHDLDGVADYDDYQSDKWTPEHVRVKVANIAQVLARVDKGAGPALVALNEIELDKTPDSAVPYMDKWLASVADKTLADLLGQSPLPAALKGLPAEAWLMKALTEAGLTGYTCVTTDERSGAVRNVLLTRFPVLAVRSHRTEGARAILEVKVDVDGSPLTVLVNHWKSGASDLVTEETRRGNAKVVRERLDEIFAEDPNADVIVTGDLNSHYNQKQRYRNMRVTAINDVLGSQGNELAIRGKDRDLYNLWFELPSDRRGSDTYQGEWGTLMHLILARGLYDLNGVQYVDSSFAVMKLPGLNVNGLGLPNRWSRGKTPAGFSDHFPLYARFRVVGAGPKDKWMPLTRPSETAEGGGDPIKVETSPVELFASAVKYSSLPAGADIRDGNYTGRIFLIEEKAHVNDKGHVKVTLDGHEYDVFSHNKELRDDLRARARDGRLRKFFGELGQYQGRWQFLVHGKEWAP